MLRLLAWLVRPMVQTIIRFYQSRISPRKGYQCACHTQRGKSSCSTHALQVLEIYSLPTAFKLIRQRSQECRELASNNGFTLKRAYFKHGLMAAGLVALTGCGGGGGGTSGGGTNPPTTLTGKLVVSVSGTEYPVSGASYTITPAARSTGTAARATSGVTGSNGSFSYESGDTISFSIGDETINNVPAAAKITEVQLASAACSSNTQSTCQSTVEQNLEAFFITVDSDGNPSDGIQLLATVEALNVPPLDTPAAQFQTLLDSQLSVTSGRLILIDPTRNNAESPISGLGYYTASISTTETGSNGQISYLSTEVVTLVMGSNTEISIEPGTTVSQQNIASSLCSGSADPTNCQYNAKKNLETFFLTLDSDQNSSNGIQLTSMADTLNLQFTLSTDQFQSALAQQLSASGIAVKPLFTPSLGINTEAPQSEQNTISFPAPFADIFRVARPFHEYSCKDATYDENGWPLTQPSNSCLIRTFLLDSAVKGAVPDGKYIVLYEGNGVLEYSGYIKRIISHTQGRDEVEVELPAKLDSVATNNRIGLKVVSGTVKNIRIVMPGGICEGTPSVRVDDANGCPSGTYRSFADTFATNRNAIVFNPAYLNFLKDFRVVRMMNLMGSSPSYLTCAKPNPANPTNPNDFEKDADGKIVIDQTCLVQDLLWEQRSEMDDAVWGTSGNSFRMERYARGAPIEVQVELANQLNAHPWFNIPHNATEYYNRQFASYVASHLKPGLKAHIEYSNETWNGIFWAYHYMLKKGEELGSPTDAWRGANYYAKQASKVFQWWEDEFGGTQRLVRLLGTYQNDSNRTDRMLAYSDVKQYVDAVATGGYFYACWDRALAACQDTSKVPKPLVEATSVNDIFAAIDNPNDPFGMSGVNSQFQKQATVASKYGKALLAYEGGQHLTLGTIAADRRQNMIDLMHAANRDPRMGERYQQLLNSWKAAGGQTFVLFSVPHTFSQYGSFGIKESLTQPRSSAPKYDGAMKFQETQGKCWWSGC